MLWSVLCQRGRSLNPYYTGIHLHYVFRYFRKHAVAVLILIILEYIYIFEYGDLTVLAGVLILIILEYIYILDDIYGIAKDECLNPYYTGIHLHLTQPMNMEGLLS